jgi:CRISPR-associated protein Csm5
MKYRFTCLTPVLAGDGNKLSPIDYMVWKDQVNVLDQRRIFKLLAKGPRLDNYLAQLKRADRLDFASWGGFAQNFAGRRVQFEHSSCTTHWTNARVETLHIATFTSGTSGPYLPGTALKGALRTALLFAGLKDNALEPLASAFRSERPPRRAAEMLEERVLGAAGACRTRAFQVSDSAPFAVDRLKIYMLRVASLTSRGRGGSALGWKQTTGGTADGNRPQDGTATFAEMAAPETTFEGFWKETPARQIPSGRQFPALEALMGAANQYSEALLEAHRHFAEASGLAQVQEDMERLTERLASVRQAGNACLLPLGWGGGLLARVAWLKTDDPLYREILSLTRLYNKAMYPGFPFPKTRRVVFMQDQPATLPGWGLLEVTA